MTPQPFFETALAGTGYCTPGTCTATLVANEGLGKTATGNLANASVWSLWSDLDQGGIAGGPGGTTVPGFYFARSMMNTPFSSTTPCPGSTSTKPCGAQGQLTSGVGVNASIGYGNYNAGFVSVKMSDWHGLTMQENLTWSKALGTGAVVQATSEDTAVDPFNLRTNYGLQAFDRKVVFTSFFVYQPPFFKGQQGVVGRLLGGWTFAPVFAAGGGSPLPVATVNGGGQAFGEGDSLNFFGNGNTENAILIGPNNFGNSRHNNVPGAPGIGDGGFGVNLFKDPVAAFNRFRNPILGFDTRDSGFATGVRGLPYWNVDLSVRKNVKVTERVNVEGQVVFSNVFNHTQMADPTLDLSSPSTWGTLPGQNLDPVWSPRQMEFGIRVSF